MGMLKSFVAAGLAALSVAISVRGGVDPANFDLSVKPQDDFFRYVNGGWIDRTDIPADRSIYGSFITLRDKSESDLRTILLESAAKGGESRTRGRSSGTGSSSVIRPPSMATT